MSRRKQKNQAVQEPRENGVDMGVDIDMSSDTDVDRASDNSFPASDPPPWTLGSEQPTVAPPAAPAVPPSVVNTLPGLGPPVVQDATASAGGNINRAANDVGVAGPTSDLSSPSAPAGQQAGPQSSWRERLDTVTLARLQGGYFAVTGVWPLLHMRSFRAVTGGKRRSEQWLVKTVGVLVASIGAALVASTAGGRRPDRSTRLLATTSALGLLAIDVWYVAKRRLSPIYLLDAAAEAALAAGWSLARRPAARR